MITDAWPGYRGLDQLGYLHHRRGQRAARAGGEDPGQLLPAVHRVAWLLADWLLGTHQRSVDVAHLPLYIDEFVFHFDHRRSRNRGLVCCRLLELAVADRPVRYQDLIASKPPGTRHPGQHSAAGIHRACSVPQRTDHGEPLTGTLGSNGDPKPLWPACEPARRTWSRSGRLVLCRCPRPHMLMAGRTDPS